MCAALVPARLAIAMVTAGWKAVVPPARKDAYCDGSAGPSVMRATSRKRTARSPATPTTTSPTSDAFRSRLPTRTGTLRLPATSSPAGSSAFAAPTAWSTTAADSPRAARAAGSRVTATSRGAPPVTQISATSGMRLSSAISSAACCRSR
jgi:hypothetical protein